MTRPFPKAYTAFSHASFRRFMLGALLVSLGTAAQSTAIGWEVYLRTGDYLALGIVGLVQAVPMLILTLPGGYLADVFDRRKIMMLSLSGATLTSILLAIFSYKGGSIGWMYVILFLDASFIRMSAPARTALIPLLVPPKDFENAIRWRTSLFQIAGVVGPAIGGFIIVFSLPGAYVFCAGCSVFYIYMLMKITLLDGERSHRGNMIGQVIEGLQFVWKRQIILGSISLDLFAVLLGGAVYLLPIFAKDIITDPPWGMAPEQVLGWLKAAPAAGALAMALLLAHLPPFRHAGRTLFVAVGVFGVATIVFGFSTSFWLSWAMLFLTGFADNISVVIRHTLVQLSTPNAMRGRISAVNSVFIGSSNELGGFESGLVARLFDPVVSVVAGGLGTLTVVGGWMMIFPKLRKFGSFDEAYAKDTDGEEK